MKFLRLLSVQLQLLVILPISLFGLLIGLYMVDSRQQQIEHFTSERSKQLSKQFAIIKQHSSATDAASLLQALASSSIEEQGLHALAIIDQDKNVLAQAGPLIPVNTDREALPKTLQQWQSQQYLQFLLPLPTTSLSANLHLAGSNKQANTWLVASYDINFYQRQFYFQELGIAAIFFGLLLFGCISAWVLSTRMRRDLNRLSDYAKRFAKTKRVEKLQISSCHEINATVKTIEQTAGLLSQEIDTMRHSVALTTSDLKETIETIEIQNIELNIAKKSATKASEIKSQFLANTSHEIRTPLNGIIGFTQLLEKTPLNAEQQDYLHTIQQSSDGLLTIINDILDFSKIEAGKLNLENEPFTLQKVLDESMALFAPSAYEKGLDIALMLYQDVPQHLLGDALRIKQIIHNLLSNAVKFTDQGHIEIRASVEAENEHSCQISFEIADTGIGLSQEQQRSLFESFFQANNAMTRQYGGTGLGLSISRNLIALMHGNIGVDSSIGQGTSFYFTLKLDKNPNPPIARTPPQLLAGKTIMVCEPHTLSALSVKHLLLQLGADNVSIFEKLSSLTKASKNTADILFISTDIQQSNEQNIALLQQARQVFAGDIFALIPLCPRTEAIKQTLRDICFCNKPLNLEKLITCLKNQGNAAPTNPIKATAKPLLANQQNLSAWHILICDDHPANLKLLNILLQNLGLTVSQAENGQQAINKAQETAFDLIFMDIQMPTISGIDACNHIRQNKGPNQHTAIVALTANALNKEKKQALEQGFNRYLTKPIDTQKIEQCLLDFCGDKTPNRDIFDPQKSLNLAYNNVNIAQEMLQGLLQELENFIQSLPKLSLEKTQEKLHKIHGACAYTGTYNLQQASRAYELALIENQNFEKEQDAFLKAAKQLLLALKGQDITQLFSSK